MKEPNKQYKAVLPLSFQLNKTGGLGSINSLSAPFYYWSTCTAMKVSGHAVVC